MHSTNVARITDVLPSPQSASAAPRGGSEERSHSFAYRPALDGIRAIAVLAVVAYHLGYAQARGGYLGVDVFFVLSGYLITTLLLLERESTGRIDVIGFWFRRARRLLPALLIVLVVVALWVNATAAEFELPARRGDLLWALFYGSNWHLVATAQDYFAQYEGASLVRHTWSLAIEEQFYLVWPLLVYGALRLARGRTRLLAAICGIGVAASLLAMAVLHSVANPSRAYYGSDARAHQLLIGALLALAMLRLPAVRAPRRMGTPVALAALGLLLVAFVTFGDEADFYYRGMSAVVAIVAVSLIWGLEVSAAGFASRLLGSLPFRWVGKISYGVYLWHWPMILAIGAPAAVFAWMPGSLGVNLTRVVFTFAFAGASYYFVEQPIRRGTVPVLRRSLPRFGLVTTALVVVVVIAIGVLTTGGPVQAGAGTGGASQLDRIGCDFVICVRHEAAEPDAPVVALVGDSIARSLDIGFVERAEREGWTYVVAAYGGCRVTHLLTSVDGDSGQYRTCYEETPGLHARLISRWDPDLVIVVENIEMADFETPSGRIVQEGTNAHMGAEQRGLRAFTEAMTRDGARLVFVEAQPNVTPRSCLRREAFDSAECAVPASRDDAGTRFNTLLESVVRLFPGRAFSVSVTEHLCPGGLCRPEVDGVFARYDGHHYTKAGARWVVPILFAEMLRSGALRGTGIPPG